MVTSTMKTSTSCLMSIVLTFFLLYIFSPFTVFSQKTTDSNNGKPSLPKFIEARHLENDPSIINDTNLKVYLLFYQNSRENRLVPFGEELYSTPKIYKNKEGVLIIEYPATTFLIRPNGVEIKKIREAHNTQEAVRLKEIEAKWYTTAVHVERLPNGEFSKKYEDGKVSHKIEFGEFEVDRKREPQCDDTGTNPITIYRNNKKLAFRNIRNLGVFECDIDDDGKCELFILSFACCEGLLTIYKVTE